MSKVGIPQVGLNPVLFIIHTDKALRELRNETRYSNQIGSNEIAYVDDMD